MRKAPGKKYGYVIIPVVVPPEMSAVEALDSSDVYNVVWTVLNALRAHNDRFEAEINKIDLNRNGSGKIIVDVIGKPGSTDYGEGVVGSCVPRDRAGTDVAGTRDACPYHVTKMKFAKKEHSVDENKDGKLDRRELEDWARIIYNDRVTIRGIPLAAYDHVVNGKSGRCVCPALL